MIFDLAISYEWMYDIEFTHLIEERFQRENLSTFVITTHNCNEVTNLVKEKKLFFRSYLDRASDVDENFSELAQLLTESDCRVINEYANVDSSVDKSIAHQKLVDAGLRIPKTIIIPSYETVPSLNLTEEELNKIGQPFVVKPAYYSGGSEGVYKNVNSFEEIQSIRQENSDDKYLIQEKIYSTSINNQRAWFRVLWAFGKVLPMLWDDQHLIYSDVTLNEIDSELLKEINLMMNKISSVAQLDYFSSEFALDSKNNFYLIDYINDQCDMRLKSSHKDGVPNYIVEEFIDEMIKFVKQL